MIGLTRTFSPSAADMIRADHTRVLAAFHRYDIHARPGVKQALVNTVCLALDIHAQIEEEIFYPAVRALDPGLVDKSVPEHQEMRRLIGQLRGMDAANLEYDGTFMQLMRDVIHHVADEETVLLPQAERVLADQLPELGARMSARRVQLAAPRMGEMAMNSARAHPAGSMLFAAGGLMALYALTRARRVTHHGASSLRGLARRMR
jgi:hemerythrin superfamily protein